MKLIFFKVFFVLFIKSNGIFGLEPPYFVNHPLPMQTVVNLNAPPNTTVFTLHAKVHINQCRWSLLKTEGAMQKLGGRNTQNNPILTLFWWISGKLGENLEKQGGDRPNCLPHPLQQPCMKMWY